MPIRKKSNELLEEEVSQEQQIHVRRRTPRVFRVLVVLFALSLLSTGYFFTKYHALKENPASVVDAENEELIKEVNKHMILPSDEVPTVATVTDPSSLSDEPFFKNAKKGYKLLIYTQAGKVILFDPIKGKIVDVTSLQATSETADVSNQENSSE